MPANSLHIHIPTPGDHYSAATGSAIMTIIFECARHHAARGGETQIVVGQGTRHDYPIGRCTEVNFSLANPPRWQKLADVALGRAALPRRFGQSRYSPALEAIPADFPGPVLVHNNPVAMRMLRTHLPKAQLCLWA